MLETGDIARFAKAGNDASYCRCVGSAHLSNGERKGQGNTKNGNKYLAWAFVEAANFAVRYNMGLNLRVGGASDLCREHGIDHERRRALY